MEKTVVLGGQTNLIKIAEASLNLKTSRSGQLGVVTRTSTGTFAHSLLRNRDLDDQHPISAITGLQDALDAAASSGLIENLDQEEVVCFYCGTASEVMGS